MMRHFVTALGLAILAAGCTPPEVPQEPAAVGEQTAQSACPDDGPRLPITNICAGRAANYLNPEVLWASDGLPEGCMWVVNETAMGADDEAILYQAARCGNKTTQLELRAGARSGALGYVTSALYDNVPADFEPVRIFTTEGQADPKAAILAMVKATTVDKREAAACEVQPYSPPGSKAQADAFVIDVSAAYRAANKITKNDVHTNCGPFGTADGQRYWSIRQGYAWFVDFGQDSPDFNPNSILRMKREASGTWTAIP